MNLFRPFAQCGCTFLEKHWSVCFWDSEGSVYSEEPSEDCHEALYPAPAFCLTEEASDDRTQRWSHERRSGEDRHGETTLRGWEHVCYDPSCIRRRRGTEGAGEEAEDYQGLNVLSTCRSSIEGREDAVSPKEEDLATIKL